MMRSLLLALLLASPAVAEISPQSSAAGTGATVNVAGGGTGVTSITQNALIYGNGTSPILELPVMDNGGLIIGTNGVPSTGTVSVSAALAVTNGVGTISLSVDSTSVAVKSSGLVRNSEIDSSSITKLSGGLVPNYLLDASSVTKLGPAINLGGVEVAGTLTVGNGGTGATSLTDGGVLFGAGTGAITASDVLTNGQLLIGDGTTAPVAATLSVSAALAVANGAGSITLSVDSSSVVVKSGNLIRNSEIDASSVTKLGNAVDLGGIEVAGTLTVGNGGTGATSLTNGGILFGAGTGALTASSVLANGQLLIGDGTTAPTAATLTAGAGISVTNGAGSITIAEGIDVLNFVSSHSFSAVGGSTVTLSGFQSYYVVFVATTSDSTQIQFTFANDAGASAYKWVCTGADAGGTGATGGSSGDTKAEISANVSNTAADTITANLLVRRWPLGQGITSWVGDVEWTRTGGNPLALTCGGKYVNSSNPATMEFRTEAGTMSGVVYVKGETP